MRPSKKNSISEAKMFHATVRLDQALRYWEDRCFIHRIMVMVKNLSPSNVPQPLFGALLNASQFRDELLHVYDGSASIDISRYELPAYLAEGLLARLPGAIHAWTRHSRRVYDLDPTLQAMLEQTPINNVRWNEVPWPFRAFAVTLGRPISVGMREYDTCIFSKSRYGSNRQSLLNFILLKSALGQYAPLTLRERNNWLACFKQRKFKKFKRLHAEYFDRVDPLDDCIGTFIALRDNNGPAVVQSPASLIESGIAREDVEKAAVLLPMWENVFRVVVGLCLYLRSGQPSTRHPQLWLPNPSTPDPSAITNTAQVCRVTCSFTFDPAAVPPMVHVTGAPHEKCAHWREGHWRRKWFGHDEDGFPRRTWIRPTLVRADRLGQGMIPTGSTKITV